MKFRFWTLVLLLFGFSVGCLAVATADASSVPPVGRERCVANCGGGGGGGGGGYVPPPPPSPRQLSDAAVARGSNALEGGRLKEAEAEFLQAIRLDPSNPRAYNNLGVVYDRMKRHVEAERYFREALRADPGYALAQRNLDILLRELDRQRKELERQRQFLALDKAAGQEKQGRYAEAERLYREVLRMNPRNMIAWHDLGLLLEKLGRLDEAERTYRGAIQIDSKARYMLENMQKRQRQRAFDRAEAMRKEGRHGDAEKAYREILRESPRNPAAWNSLGLVLWKQGRAAEAERAFRKVLGINPGAQYARENLADLSRWVAKQEEGKAFQRASDLTRKGQAAEAEQAYREILRKNPQSLRGWNNLAGTLWRQGRLEDAEAAYRRTLAIDSKNASAQENLNRLREEKVSDRARSLALGGKHSEAEAAYRRLLESNPRSSQGWNNLGNALWAQGKRKEAEEAYRKALSLAPHHSTIQKNLSMAESYNKSFARVFDPVREWGRGVGETKAVRAAAGYLERSGGALRDAGGEALLAARRGYASAAESVRGWLGKEVVAPGFSRKPLVDLSSGPFGSPEERRQWGWDKAKDWLKEEAFDRVQEKVPGARIVRSLGEKYKTFREEMEGTARRNVTDLFSTMREGVGELGKANVSDDLLQRAWQRFEQSGNEWRASAEKLTNQEIKSRLEGKDFFGQGKPGESDEGSRVVPSNGAGNHPDSPRWDYHKWFLRGE